MTTKSLLHKHGYREIKKIGEGSFGQALLVQDETSGAKLVVKMINVSSASPKEVQDTRKEAQLLAAFKHPFIVEYCANFLESGYLCILMTFCEGGDLTTQVDIARKAKRYLQEAQVLRWITQALLAVKYIHDKHVLHRDLKSGNFFLSKAGNLKMGDFGIAKVLSSTQAVARTQIGTPYYLSPEVCQDKPYSWSSDIWAMGVIMYELCALKLPFDGGSNMIVLVQAICRGQPAPLPEDYSDVTRRLCLEMLSKSAQHRPSSGAILARPELACIVQGFFEEAKQKAAAQGGSDPSRAAGSAAGSDGGPLQLGDLVEYYSNTHGAWLPAVIIGADGGRVTIDIKPNTWMTPEQQERGLRRRGQAEAQPKISKVTTAAFDSMLEGEDDGMPATAAQAPAGGAVHVGAPPATPLPPAPAAGKQLVVGIADLDEECCALLEELGLEHSVAPEETAGAAPPLSQEEMDILNDSLLNQCDN